MADWRSDRQTKNGEQAYISIQPPRREETKIPSIYHWIRIHAFQKNGLSIFMYFVIAYKTNLWFQLLPILNLITYIWKQRQM